MPIPKRVAAFNRVAMNRITRPLASHLPGFAVIRHRGRRSGRSYATPVNVCADGDRFVVALTYGSDTDWLTNALAAGGCVVEHRGAEIPVTDPLLLSAAEGMAAMPAPVRAMLRMLDVTEFVSLRRMGPPESFPGVVSGPEGRCRRISRSCCRRRAAVGPW